MTWIVPAAKTIRLALRLGVAVVLYACLRGAGFYGFTGRETEGLNALIVLVGAIYSVLLAFTIFVIWGQFSEVESCVMRECDSLDDLLRFSEYVNPDAHGAIRISMKVYVQRVLKAEWAALGDGQRDKQAESLFSQLVKTVVELAPQNDAEWAMRVRLIDIVQKAGERRDERVAKSLTRIPDTLAALVNTIANVLLCLIFIYPFHHWLTGMVCFVVVGVVLFLADFVMMDTDNPLKGVWNVSPKPFSELKL
jgi:hypothetical protein